MGQLKEKFQDYVLRKSLRYPLLKALILGGFLYFSKELIVELPRVIDLRFVKWLKPLRFLILKREFLTQAILLAALAVFCYLVYRILKDLLFVAHVKKYQIDMREGVLLFDEDTIDFTQIEDVDAKVNLFNLLSGTKTLIIRRMKSRGGDYRLEGIPWRLSNEIRDDLNLRAVSDYVEYATKRNEL